ncbi:MAG TPA: GNAT family N-acetyltransferase [Firmicutes bacterium]|nr:GNAT family N-acetyltransferase [Bacillota bacterium]
MTAKNTPTLYTQQLILRQFNEMDLPALYDLLKDGEVNTFLPWLPVKNMEEAKSFLHSRFLNYYKQPSAYRYAICLKEDNKPIGYVCLSEDISHDFGYALKKDCWHKGYATQSAHAVIQRLKKDGYSYITATHDINNPRSGEVMKRIGMQYKYSYIEQWQPKNIKVTFRMYQLNLDGNKDRTYMGYWDKYEEHFIENLI